MIGTSRNMHSRDIRWGKEDACIEALIADWN